MRVWRAQQNDKCDLSLKFSFVLSKKKALRLIGWSLSDGIKILMRHGCQVDVWWSKPFKKLKYGFDGFLTTWNDLKRVDEMWSTELSLMSCNIKFV